MTFEQNDAQITIKFYHKYLKKPLRTRLLFLSIAQIDCRECVTMLLLNFSVDLWFYEECITMLIMKFCFDADFPLTRKDGWLHVISNTEKMVDCMWFRIHIIASFAGLKQTESTALLVSSRYFTFHIFITAPVIQAKPFWKSWKLS